LLTGFVFVKKKNSGNIHTSEFAINVRLSKQAVKKIANLGLVMTIDRHVYNNVLYIYVTKCSLCVYT
jgi:hypothetical protein